ncbi:MAG: YHS domain-containing protein [Rhodospirillaceae bacterium]|jgi:YHS domain-containing protein|nr:YHS domain-containing protein [Rhodospirillaceae bacterium]MBT5525998.1 YHS domain-containing protein [Rhodospirillaceae bacterium]MBT5881787.1 YHS domain-containing protein [Rhodospirillaceae bacterium]MBT7287273.1 YHS domain-containing protein [Rhodospirillaceae bacterium]
MMKIGLLINAASIRQNALQRIFYFSAIIFLLVVISVARAAEAPQHINVDADGYSIDRYDPVAYFTEGQPVRGKPEFSAEYQGAKYAFSSKKNRERFLDNPDKFVPQYGGFCAYGVVHGGKSNVDPEVWEIVDGRLYLMISGGTMSVWQKKKKTYIQMADKAWRTITD